MSDHDSDSDRSDSPSAAVPGRDLLSTQELRRAQAIQRGELEPLERSPMRPSAGQGSAGQASAGRASAGQASAGENVAGPPAPQAGVLAVRPAAVGSADGQRAKVEIAPEPDAERLRPTTVVGRGVLGPLPRLPDDHSLAALDADDLPMPQPASGPSAAQIAGIAFGLLVMTLAGAWGVSWWRDQGSDSDLEPGPVGVETAGSPAAPPEPPPLVTSVGSGASPAAPSTAASSTSEPSAAPSGKPSATPGKPGATTAQATAIQAPTTTPTSTPTTTPTTFNSNRWTP